MQWYQIVLIVLAAFIALNLFLTMLLAAVLYVIVLLRTGPKKWSRETPEIIDELQQTIYDEGDAWFQEFKDRMQDVEIISDGYKLAGEYYDLGSDRAVIIVPGRMETVRYTHYYAQVYRNAGVNILLIDNRAHGHSEGHRTALGFREYRDVLRWTEMLHDRLGNREVILHGLCIGCETCLFAACDPAAPAYLKALITDGMFARFADSFRLHITERNHRPFPVLQEAMFLEWLFTGARPMSDGPFKRIRQLQKPILFLHSREDQYSAPENAAKMYEDCPAPDKEIHWFPDGRHSRIRLKYPEEYDAAVKTFIDRHFS